MPQVKIGDDLFHVELEGPADAPVLMLSNSLGTNLAMWDPQMPELTKRFHVVRYDSRGHGQSAATEGPYSIEQLARDALGIMDELGFEKVHWIGLSKGGMVGQWLLTHAPERIERAVLANTAAQAGSADVWNDRIRTVRESGMEAVAGSVVDRWFTKDFQERDPLAVGKIQAMLDTTSPEGYVGSAAAVRDMDQRESIRTIERPVLVIVGRHDPATPPEAGALIADSIPGAELVTLEAAHLSNIEDEAAFTQAVMQFLTRRAAPPMRHAAGKAAKKASKKAAKKAPKKAKAATKSVKKAAKKTAKAAKKASKKAPKTASKKASKKAPKKVAKKASKKAAKKAPKKAGKKVAKGKSLGSRAKSFARKAGRAVRGRTR